LTLAFVFPGQGSQSVGMQADIAAAYPELAETYAEAGDVLGFDLQALVRNGPAEQLNETVNTQPAMLTAGVAAWRVWTNSGGPAPAMMAGHSLGEYTALVCAGALAFDDALRLVRRRAELMQNAVPAGEGAMAAVLGLDDQALIDVCSKASGVAEPVNFNSPGQVVIAGHRAAIESTIELAKEAGAKRAIMLPVSVPSHSSLMRPAGEALAESLLETEFAACEIPVVNASDAKLYGDAENIRQQLGRQIYSAVRWVDVINYFTGHGVGTIAECGPGKVLTGLIRRIDRGIAASCIDSPDAFSELLNGVSE
jgi:[acyl-carrier-protein] S-malonyltransferase